MLFVAYIALWLLLTPATKLLVRICGHRITWRLAGLVTAAVTIPLYYG